MIVLQDEGAEGCKHLRANRGTAPLLCCVVKSCLSEERLEKTVEAQEF